MAGCREVTRDLTLAGEVPLSGYRRVQIALHMLICRHCRQHKAQLEQLQQLLATLKTQEAENVDGMPPEVKARIRGTLSS